ncbi:hypothetical protein [Zymobacter palmae]|uniref:SAM-dependent methyltransferases n=1 Tax=Zymobacter palmae TaxID=33074 RepID=A0A348HI81_9GAMM|nr:hypothetical protein [Zymobacter palmae]BBG31333.1 SAM-dependent methyltransferases [Zymobacter palmae]
MNVKTYSIVDDQGKYMGYQESNIVPEGSHFIDMAPPSLSEGQQAIWNGQVWHIFRDNEGVDIAKNKAIDAIDSAADGARARDQSVGQLLDIEYQQVIEAHGRWYADGYDETKCPEEIKAWADAEGVTPLQAAQEIAEAAAHREEVIRQIRSIRLAGKAAVRAAADDADFTAIAGPFIDQLNHIGDTTIAAA